MYLVTLGHPALHEDNREGTIVLGPSKSLAVPAFLSTLPDHTASRDHISELLWPALEHGKARRALRQSVYYLGTCAGKDLVTCDESDLALDLSKLTVDLHEFEHALQSGDDERAIELYGGPFLCGFEGRCGQEFKEWIESQNEYLRVGLEVAYLRLVRRLVESGDARWAARYARRYVALNPLHETAQFSLIRSLKEAGDLIGALQAYRSYRVLLKRALGDQPSTELERIGAALREELAVSPAEPLDT